MSLVFVLGVEVFFGCVGWSLFRRFFFWEFWFVRVVVSWVLGEVGSRIFIRLVCLFFVGCVGEFGVICWGWGYFGFFLEVDGYKEEVVYGV